MKKKSVKNIKNKLYHQEIIVIPAKRLLKALLKSDEDSQFLESRNFQIEEIARFFKVPSILINHSDKAAEKDGYEKNKKK